MSKQVERIGNDLLLGNYHRFSAEEIEALVPLLERFNGIPSYAPSEIELVPPRGCIFSGSLESFRDECDRQQALKARRAERWEALRTSGVSLSP